jgi:hypothetical protein
MVCFIHAETITLSGTIKKTGGTAGIPGVKVSLIKIPTLSTTTGADGAFALTGSTSSVQLQKQDISPIQFMIKDNTVIFAPNSRGLTGSVTIFSGDGKMKSSIKLHDLSTGNKCITLPKLSSGISIMRISIGAESYERTLVCVGNNLLLKNETTSANNSGRFILAKQLTASAVDTLKAEKNGYTTKKMAITKYAMDSITIALDTSTGPGGPCTRDALQAAADSYVEALKAGDPTKMNLAANATYMENMKASSMGQGIWKSKLKVAFTRSFLDVDSCKTYTEVYDDSDSHPYIIGAQLKLINGQIAEVSALVSDSGDWSLSKKSDFVTACGKSKAEAWTIIASDKRDDRKTIQAAGDAYLDDFLDSTKVKVPWGNPCARLEGSMYVQPDCNKGVPQKMHMPYRKYVVDVDMGTVDIFVHFGGDSTKTNSQFTPDSHLFRVESGKLRFVHTISITGNN